MEDLTLLLWRGDPETDDITMQPTTQNASQQQPSSGTDSMPSTSSSHGPTLQLQRLHSRLVPDAALPPTSAQKLFVRHIANLSALLLGSLPGFWQAVSSSKLANPQDATASGKAAMQASLARADEIAEQLVEGYCTAVEEAVEALELAGPLQPAMEAAIQVR